jgi:hypothetical protein
MIKHTKPCFECIARDRGYASSRDMLFDLYVVRRLGSVEISRSIGVHFSAVLRRLEDYQIDRRRVGRIRKTCS